MNVFSKSGFTNKVSSDDSNLVWLISHTRALEELLNAPLSPQEDADLEVVGWLPTWRRDYLNMILEAREIVGDEFGVSDAGPRTIH